MADEHPEIVEPRGRGIATSGSYVRGQHIYDPHAPDLPIADIVSLVERHAGENLVAQGDPHG